jgi:hypothetical protein
MTFTNKTLDEMLSIINVSERDHDIIFGCMTKEDAFQEAYDIVSIQRLGNRYPIKLPVIKTLIEATINAYMWGNKSDPYKEIRVDWYFGSQGFIFSVLNEGEGFDYNEKILQFYTGEKYATRNGGGFNHYSMNTHEISFTDNGRRTNVMVRR